MHKTRKEEPARKQEKRILRNRRRKSRVAAGKGGWSTALIL